MFLLRCLLILGAHTLFSPLHWKADLDDENEKVFEASKQTLRLCFGFIGFDIYGVGEGENNEADRKWQKELDMNLKGPCEIPPPPQIKAANMGF